MIAWLVAALVFVLAWAAAPLVMPSPLAARARALGGPLSGGNWTEARGLGRWLGQPRVLPVAAGIFGLPLVLWLGDDAVQRVALWVLLVAAAVFGPRLYAANLAERRRQAIVEALPDAIDLLVICAEAGLGLDVALARTARELAPAAPALAGELALTATELGLLPNRADAFANLAARVAVPQVQALADMMVQTERFGTPLMQALRAMAVEYRAGRLLRAEARAARLPALMTVPMIAFILPPLFVVLIGPAVVEAMG
jgi:tight adherence protein C